MAVPVILPRFNMDMEEGTITRWIRREGEAVRTGDPLCEVETDKAAMEIEAPASGLLTGLRIAEGQTVPVATVLAFIAADEQDALTVHEGESTGVSVSPAAPVLAASGDSPAQPSAPAPHAVSKVRSSPAARRIAREQGIDLTALGAEGRVTVADVRAAVGEVVSSAGAAIAMVAGEPLTPTRRAIAARMLRAHAIPHITLNVEVRFGSLLELRRSWRGERPMILAFLAAATCSALNRHPSLNGTFENDLLMTSPDVNLGIAVARPQGLIVPVLKEAQRFSVGALQPKLRELIERARDGGLRPDDTRGGTFTISSLGERGVDHFTALVNPPQLAILAVGRIGERLVPADRGIRVEPTGYLSFSCDHRVIDGAPAADFLATLKELVEDPGWMVES